MSQPVTDVEEIKTWTEKYNGRPQIIISPDAGAEAEGLRISFPQEKDAAAFGQARTIRDCSWEEFGQVLNKRGWGLIFSPNPNPNNLSDSYRIVPLESVDEPEE